MNLYKLSTEMQNIINMGYDDETTQELLEGYNIIGSEQIDDIVKTIRTLDAQSVGVAYEIDRLSKIKKDNEAKKESLVRLVDNYLKKTNQNTLTTDYTKISYRKSEKIIIDDQTLLNDEYLREKITIEPDKNKIKEDLKKGIIVEGAKIEVNQNIQIK